MAKLSYVINAKDQVRTWKYWCYGKSLSVIVLCFQIATYGCASVSHNEPDLTLSKELGWNLSPQKPEPSQFDYLAERGDRIIPLVVERLRQSTNQRTSDSLGCLERTPIDKVIIGGSESVEFRDFLT